MKTAFKTFCKDDCGAVTVDWVVLAAAVVGIVMLVLMPVVFSTTSATQSVSDYIGNVSVGYESN
jgi:Flp pilus assembly pilin Flp